MAARESLSQKMERLFAAGDGPGGLRCANELLAQSPGSFIGRLGRARGNIRTGNYVEAHKDIDLALLLSPNDHQARMTKAALDLRLGRTDEAVENMTFVANARGPHSVEATISLLLALHGAGRNEQFLKVAHTPGPWTKDPRAELIRARVVAIEDPEKGIVELIKVFRTNHPVPLRRFAGFEAVGILDKKGRYREAYDLAMDIHTATTDPLDMDTWLTPLQWQLQHFEKPTKWYTPRAPRVEGVAFIAAMPRSGTTLLEQMLDRHPAIGGIGEFDGLDHVCRTLFDGGSWPRVPRAVPDRLFVELQAKYLEGAHQIRKEGAAWTFDKSLRGWRALPEIATVFPGAVCINVDRDPRDMATSIFLSYFNPSSYEWTRSFDAIRQIVSMERRIVPRAFEVLELPSVSIVYEDLIEDPAHYAEQCLRVMGLPMDERVLSPEQNTKAAFTLSHHQVRQPINRKSIGRWKNYEWAFDSRWDDIVAAHEARRTRK